MTLNFRHVTALCGIALFSIGAPAFAQNTIADPTTGFTFTVPKGWRVMEVPGLKNKIAATTPYQGFAPNINVVDAAYSGNLGSYAKANRASMMKMFPTCKEIGETSFSTQSGALVERTVVINNYNGKVVRQVFYMMKAKGDRVLVFTLSNLAPQGDIFDKPVDAAIRAVAIR